MIMGLKLKKPSSEKKMRTFDKYDSAQDLPKKKRLEFYQFLTGISSWEGGRGTAPEARPFNLYRKYIL